ncbi:beta strand repeat-containing protein [Halopseudomonas salegens]|uniref:Putative Ig domain-containing protein n=1 Tax=Halopseudomonas salegens TaxID=1434072 RepID=A0A1H2EQG8_9GAMM|nr:putative Ig domain-containing protein [Halopseudomonas salegens]SDT96978.1 Putative Ig domain-containing protein [Halopseudomonas salegens]
MNIALRICPLIFLAWSAVAHAVPSQYDLYLDFDNDAATGCQVITPDGPVDGIESVLTTYVETSGLTSATVVGVERRDCIDAVTGTFGAPEQVSAGGWDVGVGNGLDGFNVVETFMPIRPLADGGRIRMVLVASDDAGNTSVMGLASEPIILAAAEPISIPTLTFYTLSLLAILMLGIGVVVVKRQRRLTLFAVIMLSSGSLVAATCVLDGEISDWNMSALLAATAATDPDNGVDLRALFGKRADNNSRLCIRIDSALLFATPPVLQDDQYDIVGTDPLAVPANGVLANDDAGLPEGDLIGFGGGDLAGAADANLPGATVAVGTDGSLTVEADGSLQFQAESGFSGQFTFQYRVENVAGTSDATVTIEVQSQPQASDASYEVLSGESLNIAAPGVLDTASGVPMPQVDSFGGGDLGGSVADNAAGDNVVVGADGSLTIEADGSLTFQSPTDITGDLSFQYQISNAVDNDTATVTLTINLAPSITSAASLDCDVGTACPFTFAADGFPQPDFSLTGALPGGMSFDAVTGSLQGTPAAGSGQEYPLEVTATNGIGVDDTQSFTLTVSEAPVITSADNLACELNEPCNFTFAADGFPDPEFALPSLPAGLTIDNTTGVLSGAATVSGEFNLTLTASNALGDDTQAFTLSIGEAPTITSANNLTCVVGASCDFTFTTDGFPDPSFSLPGLPAGLTLDGTTGVLSGTPDAGTGAEYNLTLTATNGIVPDDSQAFTLTINEAPEANDDPAGGIPTSSSPGSMPYHGSFDTVLNVSAANGVLGNDVDGFPQPDISTLSPITTVGGGSVTLNSDGSFSYTPNSGFTGIDTFQYCIENAGGDDCATVAVAVGERPEAADATYPHTLLGNVDIDTTRASNFSTPPPVSGDAVVIGLDSTTNGDATVNANGTFTFSPAAGVTNANATLVYSLTNGFGSATGTIELPIGAERIWFVDNSTGAGDGRLSTPFNNLVDAEAAATNTGERIFVFTGSGTYVDGITLLDEQRLLGQSGVPSLEAMANVTLPIDSALPATGGTAPVIANGSGSGVTLATNNRIQGFTVGNTAGSGITGSSFGTLTVADVSINGSGQALDLNTGNIAGTGFDIVSSSSGTRNVSLVAVDGTLNLGGGSLSGASGQAFFVDGGIGVISYAGSINNTASRVAEIQNKTDGAVTLSGTLTSNAGGTGVLVANNSGGSAITFSGASKTLNTGANAAISLNSNTGATVNFINGGLDIDTTSGTGFSATGGGTVTVSGLNNTVDGTNGTSVNIANTLIGATGMTFQRVSSNGGTTPGIVLNNTGGIGGLTVAGNGGSCTSAGTCSGGSIRNKAADTDGISLTNTSNARFNFMHIASNTRNGIFGSDVNGFELVDSLVDSNADQAFPDEAGILMSNLTGTLSGGSNPVRIVRSTIRNSYEHNIKIENNTGTLADLVIDDSVVRDTPSATGANGLLMQAIGTASMGTTVTNSSFIANKSNGIQADAGDVAGSFVRVDVDNSTFTGAGNSDPSDAAAQNVGVNVSTSSAGAASFTVNNSSFTGHRAIGINFFANANTNAATRVTGTITGNTIGTPGVTNSGSAIGSGIDISNEGANRIDVLIDNNTVQGVGDGNFNGFEGIFINDVVNAGTINATVTNNIIRDIYDDRGLVIQERVGGTHCSNISGNSFSNIGGISDMRVRQTAGTHNIVQSDPGGAAPNLSTVNGNANITVSGALSFGVGSSCPTP